MQNAGNALDFAFLKMQKMLCFFDFSISIFPKMPSILKMQKMPRHFLHFCILKCKMPLQKIKFCIFCISKMLKSRAFFAFLHFKMLNARHFKMPRHFCIFENAF